MLYIYKRMNYMDFVTAKLIFAFVILFFLLIYWVFNFIILYHLARFGVGTQPKKFAIVFLIGSVALFFASVLLFANLDFNLIKNQIKEITNLFFNVKYLQWNPSFQFFLDRTILLKGKKMAKKSSCLFAVIRFLSSSA